VQAKLVRLARDPAVEPAAQAPGVDRIPTGTCADDSGIQRMDSSGPGGYDGKRYHHATCRYPTP
jgi:hypothetical protein